MFVKQIWLFPLQGRELFRHPLTSLSLCENYICSLQSFKVYNEINFCSLSSFHLYEIAANKFPFPMAPLRPCKAICARPSGPGRGYGYGSPLCETAVP